MKGSEVMVSPAVISYHFSLDVKVAYGCSMAKSLNFTSWFTHEDYDCIVEKVWFGEVHGDGIQVIQSKMKTLKSHLRELNKAALSHISCRVVENQRQLETVQSKAPQRVNVDLEEELKGIFAKTISQDDRCMLNKNVTEEEIKAAMKGMKNGRAPGPDGYTSKFFKHSGQGWVVVKLKALEVTWVFLWALHMRYLDIPLTTKQVVMADCRVLIEKVTGKIESWENQYLSFAGRVVLINTVIFGIINYWCQSLCLPVEVVDKLKEIMRLFLWKGKPHERFLPKVSWEKVTK
ncbi:hypothetical protein Leryth_025954 [Lithospermum erythrorhizon]|nr:hypothetical protein Leryth_025954 [Lithospermum erythrorhizon]